MHGLYAIKPWYTRRLRRLVDAAVARRLSPDVFTAAGVAAAVLAAVCIAHGWWLGALLALAARLAGANLDGAVARARGVTRSWGFVLNEVGDRASDLIVFAGLGGLAAGSAGWASSEVVLVAVAAASATLPTSAALAAAGAGAPGATEARSARPNSARCPWWPPPGRPRCPWSAWSSSSAACSPRRCGWWPRTGN